MSRAILFLSSFILASFMVGCSMQPVELETATAPATEAVVTEVPAETATTETPTTEAATPSPAEMPSPFSAEILKNFVYNLEVVPTGSVTLTNGVYEDADNLILVNWIDTYALGQLNGQPAAAVVLLANTGGSGTFSTLAIVVEQDGELTNIASALLGDRVSMNWVAIADNEIMLDLVTQGPDEPMCCGTQRTLVSFMLDGDQLVAGDAQVIGVQPQITGTQVITYLPSLVPDIVASGSCFTNAIGLGRADAWRCTTDDNLIHDPCFEVPPTAITPTGTPVGTAAEGEGSIVVCGADPITGERGFRLVLTEPLPAPDPGNLSNAWLVQLADGTYCGLLTGTVPGVDGQVAPYGCADEARSNLMEEFLIFDPVWYAQSVVFSLGDEGFVIDSSVRIPVATIWR
jgi:hypothetical protein